MKRYLKLFKSLIGLSVKRYLEYRANAITGIIGSAASLFIDLLFLNIVFSLNRRINGWEYNEALLLLGTSRIILSLFWIFVQRGISHLSFFVRNGDLDFLLTKPVNPQFYTSFRLTRVYDFLGLITGSAILIYAFSKLDYLLNISNLLYLFIGIICGCLVLYSLYFSIATLSIWIVNFNSLGVIYYIISSVVTIPTNIYSQGISFILTYCLLVGMIVTIPIESIINNSFGFVTLEILSTIISFAFCVWFWNFALKHYTSASS